MRDLLYNPLFTICVGLICSIIVAVIFGLALRFFGWLAGLGGDEKKTLTAEIVQTSERSEYPPDPAFANTLHF